MKITGKYSVAFFLKLGIDLILLTNILVLLFLPFILNGIYRDPEMTRSGYEDSVSYTRQESETAGLFSGSGWILSNEIPEESYEFMLGFLYFSGIGTALILFFLRKIIKNLANNLILEHSNAVIFKHMSRACFFLVFTFIIKILFYNSFLSIFCFFLFIILGLFSLLLSEVFRQGALVKEENELTI